MQELRCILCGREIEAEVYRNARPGDLARCALHLGKAANVHDLFTVEEAHQEGIKRVNSITPDEMEQEGLTAFAELEKYRQALADPKERVFHQYYLDVIEMKKAYLSAFD